MDSTGMIGTIRQRHEDIELQQWMSAMIEKLITTEEELTKITK